MDFANGFIEDDDPLPSSSKGTTSKGTTSNGSASAAAAAAPPPPAPASSLAASTSSGKSFAEQAAQFRASRKQGDASTFPPLDRPLPPPFAPSLSPTTDQPLPSKSIQPLATPARGRPIGSSSISLNVIKSNGQPLVALSSPTASASSPAGGSAVVRVTAEEALRRFHAAKHAESKKNGTVYVPPRLSITPTSQQRARVISGPATMNRLPGHITGSTSSSSLSANAKGKGKEVVDLTGSDEEEDEVVIQESPPICLGVLQVPALILRVERELTASVEFPPGSLLHVHLRRGISDKGVDMLELLTPLVKVFGFVDPGCAAVLAPLLGDGYSGTGVATAKGGKMWCEATIVRRKETHSTILTLRLLIFARPFDVPHIANKLADATLILQNPDSYDPKHHHGARFYNPHSPMKMNAESERQRVAMNSSLAGGSGMGGRSVQHEAVDVQRQQVDDVFQNLKSGVDVEECEPPAIVTTNLYPHQKQALAFLLDRERGNDPLSTLESPATSTSAPSAANESYGLWRAKTDSAKRVIGWKNLVTLSEIEGAAAPPQARGALLADDMGVGKSIVVISLIASTLAAATIYATQPLQKERTDARFASFVKEKDDQDGAEQPAEMGQHSDLVKDVYGDTGGASGSGGVGGFSSSGKLSKKKIAKAERDAKRSAAAQTRFGRLRTRSRGTLIVCPLSTVQNWESQFEEHVAGTGGHGQLSIYIYHGTGRTTSALHLAKYDVVITTFSTLGAEFSKQSRAEEQRENDVVEAEAKQEELDDEMIVCDANGVELKPVEIPKVVLKGKRKRIEGSGTSPLQEVQWYRIVLDEAHIIKEHTTIQARAACDLSSSRRIALSGTPLQNSLNDLFSLVRFLRLEPFTDRSVWTQYIGAPAKVNDPLGVSRLQLIMRHLALRRTKKSVDVNGRPILDLPPNDIKLVRLEFSAAEHAFYRSRHTRYKHDFAKLAESDTVMKNYCSILQELMRLRQICVHMALVRDSEDSKATEGDLVSTIATHGISKPRAIQLLGLMKEAGAAQCAECGVDMLPGGFGADQEEVMDDAVTDQKPKKKGRKSVIQSATTSANVSEDDQAMAGVAATGLRMIVTKCQHLFCRGCFQSKVCPAWPNAIKADDRVECTFCGVDLTPALDAVEVGATEVEKAILEAVEGDGDGKKGKKVARLFEHSTKTQALLRDLFPFSQANPFTSNFNPSSEASDDILTYETGGTIGFQPVRGEIVKSVVFSQWTKLLDRAGDALDSENIKYTRLDGSMNRDQRTKAMDEFKSNPACEVFLVSLRAGGVGLNLTSGRRVYICEPFYNPAVENQAIDRIHRLGQTKPVQTIRFIISKSIEENMLIIQSRKTDLANMSLTQTRSKADLAKQRMEDLKTLMQ